MGSCGCNEASSKETGENVLILLKSFGLHVWV